MNESGGASSSLLRWGWTQFPPSPVRTSFQRPSRCRVLISRRPWLKAQCVVGMTYIMLEYIIYDSDCLGVEEVVHLCSSGGGRRVWRFPPSPVRTSFQRPSFCHLLIYRKLIEIVWRRKWGMNISQN